MQLQGTAFSRTLGTWRWLALSAGLLLATEARGQWELGGCVGLNLATQRYRAAGRHIREGVAGLPHFGVSTAYNFGPNLAVQPELFISQLGTRHDRKHPYTHYTAGRHTDFLQYLVVAVPMVGRIPFGTSSHHYFAVGGGPYAAVVTFAELTKNGGDDFEETDDLAVGNETRAEYRRFDGGMTLRTVYELRPGKYFSGATVFTGLIFTYGMVNLMPSGDEKTSRYTRAVSLTVGVRGHMGQKKTAPAPVEP